MLMYKCKSCGGNLNVNEGDKVVECEYCGTKQTIPTSNDEKILKQLARGNALRNEGEFDKAYSLFEQVIIENAEAESYWNLLLCKYGITYVDDYDGKKKPTINRMSMNSILEDSDYKKVLDLADVVAKERYIEEANEINRLQTEIINIAKKEKPYDIFISYKETDESGDRTKDSILAQDIYNALEKEGYKVFLSRVTLSSIAGQAYEPYIYSALYSSKLMVLVTTNEEYVNAVWVKNEWSRFLGMMKNDSSKKIIPCYADMDAYDLPKEIRNLQAIDLGRLGSIQDLLTGVDKIFGKNIKQGQKQENTSSIESLLKRAKLFLEDMDFDEAANYANKVLDINPECTEAYEILLAVDYKTTIENIEKGKAYILDNKNYKKIMMFGDNVVKEKYEKTAKFYFENLINEINNDIGNIDECYDVELMKNKLEKATMSDEYLLNSEVLKKLKERYSYLTSPFESTPCAKLGYESNAFTCFFYDSYLKLIHVFQLNSFTSGSIYNQFWAHKNFIYGEPFKKEGNKYKYYNGEDYKFAEGELIIPYRSIKKIELEKGRENFYTFEISYENSGNITCESIFVPGDQSTLRDGILKFSECLKKVGDRYNFFVDLDRVKSYLKESEENESAKENKSANCYASTSKSGGCYVATCVYGSYDCPEVWRLRRYRDFYLDKHWWGRIFIKIYYAISPKLVKLFGEKKWFKNPIKRMLDKKQDKLAKRGYSDTKYIDKY